MKCAELIAISELRALAATGEARRIREAARVSAGEVAAAIGTSVINIGRWDRGTRVPRGPVALRYAELLGQLREVAQVNEDR